MIFWSIIFFIVMVGIAIFAFKIAFATLRFALRFAILMFFILIAIIGSIMIFNLGADAVYNSVSSLT